MLDRERTEGEHSILHDWHLSFAAIECASRFHDWNITQIPCQCDSVVSVEELVPQNKISDHMWKTS